MEQDNIFKLKKYNKNIKFDMTLASDHIMKQIIANNDFYEPELLSWLASINLWEGDVIDIGASFGNHTLFFSHVLEKRVMCFEVNPISYKILKKNIKYNQLENQVSAYNIALADSSYKVNLKTEDSNNIGATAIELDQEGTYDTRCLDEFTESFSRKISIIKIDVEGLELSVLQGGLNTIDQYRPLLLIECMTENHLRQISLYLKDYSYQPVAIFCDTPVIVFCPKIRLNEIFYDQTPNFHSEYRVYQSQKKLESKINKTYRMLDQVRTNLGRISETKESRQEKEQEIERLNQELEQTQQSLQDSQQSRQEKEQEIERLNQELEQTQQSLQDSQQSCQEKEQEIERLNQELEQTQQSLQAKSGAHKRAADNYYSIKASKEFQLGDIVIDALQHPGRKTLALPLRLFRLLSKKHLDKEKQENNNARNPNPVATEQKERLSFTPKESFSQNKNSTFTNQLPESLKELRIACIVDEFTYKSYQLECHIKQLTPSAWKQELENFKPQILFVESAWKGKAELWKEKINHASRELINLITWCRQQGIPTIFWNKEDPTHFETFINTAFLFDYVFTTDIDCVKKYKEILKHKRIYPLLFACQPALHNPIETYVRKDKFCFAGGYYTRYVERKRDLETFIDTLTDNNRGIDIYDRNYGTNDERYMFPEKYKEYIIGNLTFDEIDKAYKGYRYGINLNSIKQSQSMFARRAFELLASNTVIISNYSRGIRNIFGDLIISSDNGKEILRLLNQRVSEEISYRKYRLAGLRDVLSKHTYEHRLAYVVKQCFNQIFESSLPKVVMTVLVSNDLELNAAINTYQRQTYEYKALLLVLTHGYLPKDIVRVSGLQIYTQKMAVQSSIKELTDTDFIAGIIPNDYYGKHYLLDLALATKYTSASAIGKKTHYSYESTGEATPQLKDDGAQYQQVDSLLVRSSIVKVTELASKNLYEWVTSISEKELNSIECFSIDEFNYCQNARNASISKISSIVDDWEDLNLGIGLENLHNEATTIEIKEYNNEQHQSQIESGHLAKLLKLGKQGALSLSHNEQGLHIASALEDGKHQYIYTKKKIKLNELGFETKAKFYLEATPGLDVRVVFIFFSATKERLGHVIALGNRNYSYNLPEGTTQVQMGIRVLGSGNCIIKRLVLDELDEGSGCFLPNGSYLVISNNYPEYGELYRNAFLHRRVCEYREQGLSVDVFRFKSDRPSGFYEFNNIDVTSGYREELHQALESGNYKKVLVHFLDEAMWEVLKYYVDRIQIIVWVHGADIHSWHRRQFNLTTQQQKERAIEASQQRLAFWKRLFSDPHPNLHYVFVSQYLFNEAIEDVGISLPESQYSIIHNYIDTDLFNYIPKEVEQRKKILSIRPYATRMYANDLTVEAILELAKKPYFSELTFHIIGDGVLFEETVSPLKQFDNVILEQRFLLQDEIADIHKDYGIFLCPTRWDSQGVSRDEAMSSGLVPITNNIAAIPEFVDETCSRLAPPEDALALAHAIEELYENENLFSELSAKAAKQVREKRGFQQTIAVEKNLIENS
jgi:FkbM family methyltransferase